MKRGCFFTVFAALFLMLNIGAVSAAVTMHIETINDIAVKELSQPAKFEVTLKNTGSSTDYAEFYTFVDAILSPRGAIAINSGEEKKVAFEVYPSDKLKYQRTGSYTFVYYMKSQHQEPVENRLVIRILPIKDLVDISLPDIVTLDTPSIDVGIENKENFMFDDASIRLKSVFIDSTKTTSLNGLEKKNVTFEIEQGKLKSIMAGKYISIVYFSFKKAGFSIEKEIDLREKSNIATTEKETGNIFYNTLAITKRNEGNVISDVSIAVKKNIFANAFTTISIKPTKVGKSAAFYTYEWEATLKPNETITVDIKTNYLLPLGILAGIAIIAVIISVYFSSPLMIKKKVRRVKSKTGEFALKVMVQIKARKDMNKIVLRERIPHLAELHERFGTIKPSKVDRARRIIEWELPELKRGEEHIFSYVLISKVSILGGYHMPDAFATFEIKGKKKQSLSNKVIFLAEEEIPM